MRIAPSLFAVLFIFGAASARAAEWLSPDAIGKAAALTRDAKILMAAAENPDAASCPPRIPCHPIPPSCEPANMIKDLWRILQSGKFPGVQYFWFSPERIKDKYVTRGTFWFEPTEDGSQLLSHLDDNQTDRYAVNYLEKPVALPSQNGNRPFARARFKLPLYRHGNDPGGFSSTDLMTVYWKPAYWSKNGDVVPGVLIFEHLPVFDQQPYRVETKFYPHRDSNWVITPGS